jgi:hypothetical protein
MFVHFVREWSVRTAVAALCGVVSVFVEQRTAYHLLFGSCALLRRQPA